MQKKIKKCPKFPPFFGHIVIKKALFFSYKRNGTATLSKEIRVFSYLYENRRLKLVIEKNQECSANPASSSVLVMVIKKALFCSYKRNGTALSKLELDCFVLIIRVEQKTKFKKRLQIYQVSSVSVIVIKTPLFCS